MENDTLKMLKQIVTESWTYYYYLLFELDS